MFYLKLKNAIFIKKIGVNPIYKFKEKFYIGIESLINTGEEIENCIECNSLEEAEQFCLELPGNEKIYL